MNEENKFKRGYEAMSNLDKNNPLYEINIDKKEKKRKILSRENMNTEIWYDYNTDTYKVRVDIYIKGSDEIMSVIIPITQDDLYSTLKGNQPPMVKLKEKSRC